MFPECIHNSAVHDEALTISFIRNLTEKRSVVVVISAICAGYGVRSFFAKLFLSNRFEVLQHIKNSREGLDQYHGGGMNLRLKVRGLKDERTLQVKFSLLHGMLLRTCIALQGDLGLRAT